MKFKIAPEFFVIVKLGVRVTRSPAESRPNGLNGNGVEQPWFRHPDQPGAQIKAGLGGAVSWGTPTSYSNRAHGAAPTTRMHVPYCTYALGYQREPEAGQRIMYVVGCVEPARE